MQFLPHRPSTPFLSVIGAGVSAFVVVALVAVLARIIL